MDGLSILFLASLVFIIVPVTANILQLQKEIKKWISDVDTKEIVPSWLQEYARFLYFLTIVTGSAHTGVLLCNSNLFGLNVFDMGLNRRQLALFKNKRVFSIVLLEVECF